MTDPSGQETRTPDWEAFYANYRKPGYVPGYEITSKLGGGAFGIVFRARKQSIGKDYAIKFLKLDQDADLRRGVLQELDSVRLFAQVDHPNLVAIEDQGTVDGIPYLVMGFAGAETLRDRLPARDAADREELRRLFLQACRGVAALHEHALVHFDLKPANIFIKGGVARVGDYGLSRLLSHSRATLSMGRGTPYYMAPEMLRRHGDWRSDVYALGVMLYEVLLGRVPFSGESEWEVLKKHESEAPDLPATLDARDREVLRRALAKEPADRFQSVAEMMGALLGSAAANPGSARAPEGPRMPPPPDPSVAQARERLKSAAKQAGDAAATLAKHAARRAADRAREKARSAVAEAKRLAEEAGIAADEPEPTVGETSGSILRAHLFAFRLRRRVRRAARHLRSAQRASRRTRSGVLGTLIKLVAAVAFFALLFAMLVPSARIEMSRAASVTSLDSPWPDPATLRRSLPAELRTFVSTGTPDWLRAASTDPAKAAAKLDRSVGEFRDHVADLVGAVRDNRLIVAALRPLHPLTGNEREAIDRAMVRIADGLDVDGLAAAQLRSAGPDALVAVAEYLEQGGGEVLREEDRARFARLNAFLCQSTGIDWIRYDAGSPSGPAVDQLNASAGTLWRWFLRQFAYDDRAWNTYARLRAERTAPDDRQGRR
ncbi:MAG: serine/threonine-protein kinase [Planctomycetota bacterium]